MDLKVTDEHAKFTSEDHMGAPERNDVTIRMAVPCLAIDKILKQ
jgi:hypothetical protein